MGVSQAAVSTNRVNATWMSVLFQPYLLWMGLTKSVQPYCRLATATIATTPAASCTQRLRSSVAAWVGNARAGPRGGRRAGSLGSFIASGGGGEGGRRGRRG